MGRAWMPLQLQTAVLFRADHHFFTGEWRIGQDSRIRTCDLPVPGRWLCQTELHPDIHGLSLSPFGYYACGAALRACHERGRMHRPPRRLPLLISRATPIGPSPVLAIYGGRARGEPRHRSPRTRAGKGGICFIRLCSDISLAHVASSPFSVSQSRTIPGG